MPDKSHRATSVDDELYKAHMEPLTPSKSKKGSVFGSLEKMFNMLTPKKQRNSSTEGPRKVKVWSLAKVCRVETGCIIQ